MGSPDGFTLFDSPVNLDSPVNFDSPVILGSAGALTAALTAVPFCRFPFLTLLLALAAPAAACESGLIFGEPRGISLSGGMRNRAEQCGQIPRLLAKNDFTCKRWPFGQ